jgi:hypothetical protein
MADGTCKECEDNDVSDKCISGHAISSDTQQSCVCLKCIDGWSGSQCDIEIISTPTPPQPAPTTPPQPAPTPPPVISEGCYSKNYKNCLPPGYTSETDTCSQIWLPDGERSNCVALWGKCNGSSDCCGEAVCFVDNEHTACVPPSEDPDTPAPTPTPVECIICDDVETKGMVDSGKDCATFTKLHKKCNKNTNWTTKKFCQLSCYKAGYGYPGDVCCTDSRARRLRQNSV